MKRHKEKIAIYKHRREVWNEVYRIAHSVCVCVGGVIPVALFVGFLKERFGKVNK